MGGIGAGVGAHAGGWWRRFRRWRGRRAPRHSLGRIQSMAASRTEAGAGWGLGAAVETRTRALTRIPTHELLLRCRTNVEGTQDKWHKGRWPAVESNDVGGTGTRLCAIRRVAVVARSRVAQDRRERMLGSAERLVIRSG